MITAPPPVDLCLMYCDARTLKGLILAADEVLLRTARPNSKMPYHALAPHQFEALDALLLTARQLAEKLEKGLEF